MARSFEKCIEAGIALRVAQLRELAAQTACEYWRARRQQAPPSDEAISEEAAAILWHALLAAAMDSPPSKVIEQEAQRIRSASIMSDDENRE